MTDTDSNGIERVSDPVTADLIADEIFDEIMSGLYVALDEAFGTAALMGLSPDLVRSRVLTLVDAAQRTKH